MRWRQVQRDPTAPLQVADYRRSKPAIARDCSFQCVYCATLEADLGGIRMFHVEHYRPKSKFPDLEKAYSNLYYACPICNIYKGADWPGDPTEELDEPSYPDPEQLDYCELFSLDASSLEVDGRYVASKYLVNRVCLNRPHLITLRRFRRVMHRFQTAGKRAKDLAGRCLADEAQIARLGPLITRALEAIGDLSDEIAQASAARPYRMEDMRRDTNRVS